MAVEELRFLKLFNHEGRQSFSSHKCEAWNSAVRVQVVHCSKEVESLKFVDELPHSAEASKVLMCELRAQLSKLTADTKEIERQALVAHYGTIISTD